MSVLKNREQAQKEFMVTLDENPSFAKWWRKVGFLNFNLDGSEAVKVWQVATEAERDRCELIAYQAGDDGSRATADCIATRIRGVTGGKS